MGQRSAHWATGIWFLVCTGLAGIVALELSSPLAPQVTAALPGAPLPEFAPEPDGFSPPPRGAFAEIAARPLFSPTRRPFVAAVEDAEQPLPESTPIELVGTLLTKEGRAALVQPQGQDARWLRAGERIAGWQVDTIERSQVRLRSSDEAKTLELRTDLVTPAQRPKTKERSRAEGNAERDARGQAQDQEQELNQAEGENVEEAAPSSE